VADLYGGKRGPDVDEQLASALDVEGEPRVGVLALVPGIVAQRARCRAMTRMGQSFVPSTLSASPQADNRATISRVERPWMAASSWSRAVKDS